MLVAFMKYLPSGKLITLFPPLMPEFAVAPEGNLAVVVNVPNGSKFAAVVSASS